MDFIVLITTLILRAIFGLVPSGHADSWVHSLKMKFCKKDVKRARHLYEAEYGDTDGCSGYSRQMPDALIFFLTVIFPVLALYVFINSLDGIALGLPVFIISVAILLYSLGRKDSIDWFRKFNESCNRGDTQGAFIYVSKALKEEGNGSDDTYFNALVHMIKTVVQDFFVIIFLFFLIGIEGAFFSRLLFLFSKNHRFFVKDFCISEFLKNILEWVPIRILFVCMLLSDGIKYFYNNLILSKFSILNSNDFISGMLKGSFDKDCSNLNDHSNESVDKLFFQIEKSKVIFIIILSLFVVLGFL
ncbi:hypothetical protein [Oceanospirillum maris]|uniref:hypothetical protein n=1 Tax=Oceanospirillum maris TaxID=64977 RepID=UPI000419BA79|nr:hypothetical protein [Oceanospirillum maris]